MTEQAYSKFAFDNEFFELDVAGGYNAGRAGAMEQLKAEAYAAGLHEGKLAAQAEVAELGRRLAALTEKFTQAQKDWEDRTLRQLLAVWYRSFIRLLGQAAQHYPEPMLEQHLKNLLPLVRTGEDLTLRINPGARHFHDKLGLASANISGHSFRIVDDPTLPLTDCVVEWRGGGLEAKLIEHEKLVAELLTSAGATVQAPAETPPPPPAAAPAEPVQAAEKAAKSRAEELLGDEELVDALK